ncbi:MAG: ankyrin repeat domain-containing protein [Campylobacterota bacterium]|nr:ankyrin repeat domain-containing protein [Campylobacterota bacterium]
MIPAELHRKLIEACQNGNLDDVREFLTQGAEPNFNIKMPTNALDTAIQIENHKIIHLLLEHGAIIKEYVLQKAIEKDKNYLQLLVPDLASCRDNTILMGVLQAAINIDDFDLVKQAIHLGAKPASLFLYAAGNICSTEILQFLIENGFNIHAQKNMLLSEWMGSSDMSGGDNWKPAKDDLLVFIFEYFLEKPESIEKFKSLKLPDKKHLFLTGLYSNNIKIMKFALLIGADKDEALNSAHRQYNAYKKGDIGSIYSIRYPNNKSGKVDYEIIEYILNSNIQFKKTTIANAVCFKYTELLNALNETHDLEYGYEMAYKYEDDELLNYFIERGVSKEAQSFAKMKVSAIKGNIKELHQAIKDGANLEALERDVIVEVINENKLESLKCLYDSGLLVDTSLNKHLDKAMSHHKAYETISYLVEQGLDITNVRNLPQDYKKRYPAIADMKDKRFSDIFDYTMYLVKEVYPKTDGKKKDETLKRIAELSALPYVINLSQGKSLES